MTIKNPILIISSTLPYPVDSGKRVVLSGFVEYFTQPTGSTSLKYVLIGDAPEACSEHSALNITIFPTPTLPRKLFNLVWHSVIRRKKSFQESMIFSPRTCKQLRRLIESISPSLIIADTVRAGQFVANVSFSNKFLYLEDLFSLRYLRTLQNQASFPGSDIDVLGRFKSFVPPLLRKMLVSRILKRVVLSNEAKLVAGSEDRLSRCFAKSLLLNGDEVDLLKRRAGAQTIERIVPLVRKVPIERTRTFSGDPSFAFVGGLNYAPNSDGLCHFISSCLPAVLEKVRDFRLRIIGKDAGPEIKRLAAQYPNSIILEGFVPDLQQIYRESAGVIVPLRFGTGIKMKVLEALSFGVPVISTCVGIDGIPLVSGTHCLIASSASEYRDCVVQLLDIGFNAEISSRSFQFFEQNYSRKAVFELYDRLFKARQISHRDGFSAARQLVEA